MSQSKEQVELMEVPPVDLVNTGIGSTKTGELKQPPMPLPLFVSEDLE